MKSYVVRTLTSKAVGLAYERYEPKSDSTPLLVIHGLFGSKRNWGTFCRTYNEMTGREIIAVDCRNHGESEHSAEMSYPLMCHDIKNTLTQLDIPKAVVIGHSMGGKLAMTMALTMPSYIEKVIVVDVSPFPSSLNWLDEFQGYLQAMINVDFSQVKTRSDVDSILATSIPSPGIRSFILTNLRKDEQGNFSWQLNLKGLQQNIENVFTGIHLNGHEAFKRETLFVAGGKSDHLKPHDLREIRTMFPEASLEVVPDASHFVHTDQPKEFLEIVDKFLAKR